MDHPKLTKKKLPQKDDSESDLDSEVDVKIGEDIAAAMKCYTYPYTNSYLYTVNEPSSPIIINDTVADHESTWWIKPLNLYEDDKLCLVEGHDLTDKEINAAQKLAKQQFPVFSGFQDTILGAKLLFKEVVEGRPSVQILHTGMYSIIQEAGIILHAAIQIVTISYHASLKLTYRKL